MSTKHILIVSDSEERKEYLLQAEEYSVGRSLECDIRLNPVWVARRHATLKRRQRSDGSCYYQILDGDGQGKPSRCGILINGRRHNAYDNPYDLENEDEIILGQTVVIKYYVIVDSDSA